MSNPYNIYKYIFYFQLKSHDFFPDFDFGITSVWEELVTKYHVITPKKIANITTKICSFSTDPELNLLISDSFIFI
jgi:hypothetical protein